MLLLCCSSTCSYNWNPNGIFFGSRQRSNDDYDTLTSTFNKGAGKSRVTQILNEGQNGAFIIVDIDNFKNVNDTYGHQIGDEVIHAVSQQLKMTFRDIDVVWRMGGDEFAVYAVDLVNRGICEKRLRQVQNGVAGIRIPLSKKYKIGVSMGCCISQSKDCDFEKLYKMSDDALYKAKQEGKNKYVICDIA